MRASVKEIYLQSNQREEPRVIEATIIRKLPQKSCYMDTNRSGVAGSRNFNLPDVSDLEKLFGLKK